MPDTTIKFRDVTFGYSRERILFDRLNCVLRSESECGKVFSLMGPSGIGKSTFCDLVLGTIKPMSGAVQVDPATSNIAVIPQKGVIFEELNVRDNITCLKYSKTLGSQYDQESVEAVIGSLGLSQIVTDNTKASQLSGGEAQRVMLARIQTVGCNILVLDEPCSFLDNRVKADFLSAIRNTINESQILALMVTHVWQEARAVADEALFFHQGKEGSVAIIRLPIQDAEKRPPTLDSLYAIHWPRCMHFAANSVRSADEGLFGLFPEGTCSVGLFGDTQIGRGIDPMVERVWRAVRKCQVDTLVDSPVWLTTDSVPMSCVCYDLDGLALDDMESTILKDHGLDLS